MDLIRAGLDINVGRWKALLPACRSCEPGQVNSRCSDAIRYLASPISVDRLNDSEVSSTKARTRVDI
jgi:hypothetical protein